MSLVLLSTASLPLMSASSRVWAPTSPGLNAQSCRGPQKAALGKSPGLGWALSAEVMLGALVRHGVVGSLQAF